MNMETNANFVNKISQEKIQSKFRRQPRAKQTNKTFKEVGRGSG